MENPWKAISETNPQTEDGFRQIANEVFLALIAAKLTGAEYKICLCVIHHSWGFGKKSDTLSGNQIARETGLSVRTIRTAIKSLRKRRIIHYVPSDRVHRGSPLNEFLFNKHHDTWITERLRPGSGLNPVSGKSVQKGSIRVNPSSATKETTKETPRKEQAQLKRAKPSDHKKAVEYWCTAYEEKFSVKYDFTGSKDGRLIKSLLKTFGYEMLIQMMDEFLNTDEDWIQEYGGYTIGMLKIQTNKIAQQLQGDGLGVPAKPVAKPPGYGDHFSQAGTTPLAEQIRQLSTEAKDGE